MLKEVKKTYPVVLFEEEGKQVLAVFDDIDDAVDAVDTYSEIYPVGFVDVLVY
jgi:hypothetical protein